MWLRVPVVGLVVWQAGQQQHADVHLSRTIARLAVGVCCAALSDSVCGTKLRCSSACSQLQSMVSSSN
jgi:hypothetical protein